MLAAVLGAGLAHAQTVQVDPSIAPYQKSSGVSGSLDSVGSDTMNNLMTLWGEAFAKLYPNVKIQVEGKGSSTAPPALIAGSSQLGPMSRAMRATEIDQFEKKYASGTYGFFKEHVLQNGDYRDTVKEQPGSALVVQGVTEDRFGMGYSGIGYRTSGVKPLALSDKGAASNGSYADVVSGKYPLSRFLYIYVNKAPGKPLDPTVREFLKLVFSKEGQDVVVKDGYYPLPAAIAAEELKKVE
jgi:ABC-type phosphate transport system substrate-binding protein